MPTRSRAGRVSDGPSIATTLKQEEDAMTKFARDVMTPNPVCCTPTTTLVQVAKMMLQNDCGQIPVIDSNATLIGVITDRDIVCRVVAEGRDPAASTAGDFMSQPTVTVRGDATLDHVVAAMEKHQIRRVPVIDDRGFCSGIIAQADVALAEREEAVGELVREVSRDAKRVAQ
jgi:CBS domain-containing protein